MQNVKLLPSMILLGLSMFACSDVSETSIALETGDAGGDTYGGGGPPTGGCSAGQYPWVDDNDQLICGEPTVPTDGSELPPYDPGMPAPDEYLECEIEVFDRTRAGDVARLAPCGPGKPPLYSSVINFYKFDIRDGQLGIKWGEHSTTRVTRYRWDWDPNATPPAYGAAVEDAKTSHSNHWAKDDNRLRIYAMIDTPRTGVNGAGFKAYTDAANAYCACQTDTGHLTEQDSCYGFVSPNPIFTQDHVCHSDTRVQGGNFQAAKGVPVTLANQCNRGLVHRNAPTP